MSSAALDSGRSSGSGESSGLVRVELVVSGMTCAACAARVEGRLNAIENVSATVNIATEKATVTAPSSVPVQLLVEEVERAGYGAEVAGASDEPAKADGGLAGAGAKDACLLAGDGTERRVPAAALRPVTGSWSGPEKRSRPTVRCCSASRRWTAA
jgi:copper chaperone CopZ